MPKPKLVFVSDTPSFVKAMKADVGELAEVTYLNAFHCFCYIFDYAMTNDHTLKGTVTLLLLCMS